MGVSSRPRRLGLRLVAPAVSFAVGVLIASAAIGSPKAEGSGFLVGESVVMTARHVVRGACSVKVRASGKWIRVVGGTFWTTGKDAGVAEDLETLKLAAPAPGHIFDFRSSPAPRGLNLAMIGYPLGNDVSFTQGRIKAVLRLHSVPLIVVNLLGAEGASGSAFVDNNDADLQ